jgi:hypothetical protein
MNTRFNQNKTELGIVILAVTLQMLTYRNSLLNKVVKILWNLWSQTIGLENTDNLVTSNEFNLTNTMLITKASANLRWSHTLLGIFHNLFAHLLWRSLEPRWWSTAIRNSRARNALTIIYSRSLYAREYRIDSPVGNAEPYTRAIQHYYQYDYECGILTIE